MYFQIINWNNPMLYNKNDTVKLKRIILNECCNQKLAYKSNRIISSDICHINTISRLLLKDHVYEINSGIYICTLYNQIGQYLTTCNQFMMFSAQTLCIAKLKRCILDYIHVFVLSSWFIEPQYQPTTAQCLPRCQTQRYRSGTNLEGENQAILYRSQAGQN